MVRMFKRLIGISVLSLTLSTGVLATEGEKWLCDDGLELQHYDNESGVIRFNGLEIETIFVVSGLARMWIWGKNHPLCKKEKSECDFVIHFQGNSALYFNMADKQSFQSISESDLAGIFDNCEKL